jgi:hypothetical protein
MTEIRKPKQYLVLKVLVIEYWNLEFIWYLVLGICIFSHKSPWNGHLSYTWSIGPSFHCKKSNVAI